MGNELCSPQVRTKPYLSQFTRLCIYDYLSVQEQATLVACLNKKER